MERYIVFGIFGGIIAALIIAYANVNVLIAGAVIAGIVGYLGARGNRNETKRIS